MNTIIDDSPPPAVAPPPLLQDDSTETLFVPSEDLTCHNFVGAYEHLTDRQLFAWAYQTETRVRLEKLLAAGGSTCPRSPSSSLPLKSDYLLQVYPEIDDAATAYVDSVWKRDMVHYQRKASDFLKHHQDPDGSLMGIQIDDPNVTVPSFSDEEKFEGMLPVPPNFLFFEICMECFSGYDLDYIFDPSKNDPTLPRGAIMGGAVVAALTAWRDEYVVSLFRAIALDDYLEHYEAKLANIVCDAEKYPVRTQHLKIVLQQEYLTRKTELKKFLHEYFLSTGDEDGNTSLYHAGDMDIFLQAPALPRALYQRLLELSGNNTDIVRSIESFCAGGVGFCHGELHRYASALFGFLRAEYEDCEGDFVFALAKHGLSSMYGTCPTSHADLEEEETWPRNTQLIMLDPRADLLGAIMDFDLSLVGCAYDGVTVRVTPRAALSLTRKLAVVTPFCFEEKRNRKRVMKYVRRGFFPVIIDPNCRRMDQAQSQFSSRIGCPPPIEAPLVSRRCWQWNPPTEETKRKIRHLKREGLIDLPWWPTIEQNKREGKDITPFHCCCQTPSHFFRCYCIRDFEEREGHALAFFEATNNWDDEMRQKVAAVDPCLRQACQSCYFEYALCCFIQDRSSLGWESSNETDLKEDLAVRAKGIRGDYFKPSFYSGPAFDSTMVRGRARDYFKNLSMVREQSTAERFRYMLQHGTLQGYQQRFACVDVQRGELWDYPPFLNTVFDNAKQMTLASPARPPIGLNPERFIGSCDGCGKWLHGYEFGIQICSECQESKPAGAQT